MVCINIEQTRSINFKRRSFWVIAAAVVIPLTAWAVFHPEYRPDAGLITPSVRAELVKTGYKATQGITSAKLETSEVVLGQRLELGSRQKIVPIDALLTEKRTSRHPKDNSHGVLDQVSGLYVGSISVIRLTRPWTPLIGDLLPYHFWRASLLSEFVVEENNGFPDTLGGKLLARVAYDVRFADGGAGPTDRGRLRCEVKSIVAATAINSRLSGSAARIECEELLEAEGRAAYSVWYVFDRGWSIPAEGEHQVSLGTERATRTWAVKLVSFE